jgi:hypothetical protein
VPEKLIILIRQHQTFLEIPMHDISPIIDFQQIFLIVIIVKFAIGHKINFEPTNICQKEC